MEELDALCNTLPKLMSYLEKKILYLKNNNDFKHVYLNCKYELILKNKQDVSWVKSESNTTEFIEDVF